MAGFLTMFHELENNPMIESAKNQKEHYFEAILISVITILVWRCSDAGIDFSYWEVFIPFLVGIVITSILAFLKYSPENPPSKSQADSRFKMNLIHPVSFGFQTVCVIWLLVLFRKTRVLDEAALNQSLIIALAVGVVIAFSLDSMDFINRRVHTVLKK